MGNPNLSVVYGILALLSVLLFIAYFLFEHNKNKLFFALFGCVAAANSGYFLTAVCNSLAVAKIANGVSYFGGAFSILVMLLIIWDVCRMPKHRGVRWTLIGISIAAFALAASGDWLGLYYRSVSLEKINGMTLDWDKTHAYWGFYIGDTMADHGVGDEPIKGGEVYRIAYTK